jgi:AGZA family xanthine/uracil permease-like MFS transporter
MSFIILNGIPWVLEKITRGRIVPANYEASEPWIVPAGGFFPVWMYVPLFFLAGSPV